MGSAYSRRPGKQSKTHSFKSPNLQHGEEPSFPKSNLCFRISRNSKKQPLDNSDYPVLSIYGKPPLPPSNPATHTRVSQYRQETPPHLINKLNEFKRPVNDPNVYKQRPMIPEDCHVFPPPSQPPEHNLVPRSSHLKETPPPLMYMYDGLRRPVSDPIRSHCRPTMPDHYQDTPCPFSYLYDGRAQPVQGLDTKHITPLPSTYIYDGLKQSQSPSQQEKKILESKNSTQVAHMFMGKRDEKDKVSEFGEWGEKDLFPDDAYRYIFYKMCEEMRKNSDHEMQKKCDHEMKGLLYLKKQCRQQAKLLHECQILQKQLQECSAKYLNEIGDMLVVDFSFLSDARDLLDIVENKIGLLLSEVLLVEGSIFHGDPDNKIDDEMSRQNNELKNILKDLVLDNATLRKQANAVLLSALKVDDSHTKDEIGTSLLKS